MVNLKSILSFSGLAATLNFKVVGNAIKIAWFHENRFRKAQSAKSYNNFNALTQWANLNMLFEQDFYCFLKKGCELKEGLVNVFPLIILIKGNGDIKL